MTPRAFNMRDRFMSAICSKYLGRQPGKDQKWNVFFQEGGILGPKLGCDRPYILLDLGGGVE